ncbi:hypothetical protein AusDCA_2440 [Desulfitobacterium sp. AusDCA]
MHCFCRYLEAKALKHIIDRAGPGLEYKVFIPRLGGISWSRRQGTGF